MKIKKFNEEKGKQVYMNNTVANMVAKLNPGEESEVISGFQKFEQMVDTLLSDFKTRKIIGNTTGDLGAYIGQSIYPYLDDDNFSIEDFIASFKHGIENMKK